MVGTRPTSVADWSASRTLSTVWAARTDLLYVCPRRRQNLVRQIRVLLCEWRSRIGKSERVVADEDLSIALRSGADSNCGNLHIGRDPARKIRRNRLEHDGEYSRLFEYLRIFQEPVRCFRVSGLPPQSPELP